MNLTPEKVQHKLVWYFAETNDHVLHMVNT